MSRSGIQLCHPFEESRLAKWRPPYLVQPKLDGERCRAVLVGDEYVLFSSELNIINSVPHVVDAMHKYYHQCLKNKVRPEPEFDGELYRHGWEFEEIHSVVGRTVNLNKHHEMIQFHIFDLINEDPQVKRTYALRNLVGSFNPEIIKIVPYYLANNFDELMQAYNYYIDHGYEGIIIRECSALYVRHRSTFVMKFKPKKDDEYEIKFFLEAHDLNGNPKNMLGAIMCAGNDGTLFKAGAGQLTHDQRIRYWKEREEWPGKTIHVGYQNLTHTGGVPRFGVCIELLDKPFHQPVSEFFNPFL